VSFYWHSLEVAAAADVSETQPLAGGLPGGGAGAEGAAQDFLSLLADPHGSNPSRRLCRGLLW
jgi:hypothetical protein